ncbi:MAG TPA: phage tail protein [Anaerolineaceae bacterium]
MPEIDNPLVAFRFGLEIENKLTGYFTNVSGIGSENEVIDHKIVAPTGETIIQKIPGRLTWTEVTLKRGVTANIDVWKWRHMVVTGKVKSARTNCSIVAYDQEMKEIARWNFVAAWPSKVTGPEMDSGGTAYLVEEMTIVHEGMERVS